MANNQSLPHIVIVPSPGMGHLIPLVNLANRILTTHPTQFTLSFIIPTESPPNQAQWAALSALPEHVRSDSIFLPSVPMNDLPPDAKIETRIALNITRSLPSIRDHLRHLNDRRLSVLIVDLFGTDAFDVCPEFGLKPYIFYPPNATCLSLFLHMPELDREVSVEFRDIPGPVNIPGVSFPIYGKDLLDPVQDRKNDAYKWVLHHCKRYSLAEGILVNSFKELEEGPIEVLQKGGPGKPPVYAVGPVVQSGSSNGDVEKNECLKWLDEQPRGSVLFVSFGSGGTLSHDQIIELAHGLEMSELRFLWVLRSPNDKVANATFFGVQMDEKSLDFLPQGFLDRTKGRGLVVPSWAPQYKILSHEATGGFLSHCGWNSVLESVVNGVPLIAWPLYAEQKMNTVMLTEGAHVALRANVDEHGLVRRGAIANLATGLMEGEEGKKIRNKMKYLKDAAARATSEDGSSTKALSEVALKWLSQ